MARREKPSQLPAERPEFPKPLVRLRAEAGGYGCEVRMVGDGAEETAAGEGGFREVPVPLVALDFQEYPKMLYTAEGAFLIVATAEAEAKAAEGGYSESRTPPVVEPPPPAA